MFGVQQSRLQHTLELPYLLQRCLLGLSFRSFWNLGLLSFHNSNLSNDDDTSPLLIQLTLAVIVMRVLFNQVLIQIPGVLTVVEQFLLCLLAVGEPIELGRFYLAVAQIILHYLRRYPVQILEPRVRLERLKAGASQSVLDFSLRQQLVHQFLGLLVF